VRFYEKTGFTSTSLGEKYPGVERFLIRRRPAQLLASPVITTAGTIFEYL
jgi:hypothetical protein